MLDHTVFVVTADHGMAPLKQLIPDDVLDNTVTEAGITAPETTDSPAGYIWLQDATKAQAVAENVVAAKNPYVQSVYYKVSGKTGDSYVWAGGLSVSPQVDAANQYLLSSFSGGNAPDVVAFCTEETAFLAKGAESWKGNHGGGAWESQHVPLLIAGADVLPDRISYAPARIEDIAPTVLALFGVKATGMQGSVLADALQQPTSVQVRDQNTLNKQLTPIVDALAGQSRSGIAAR